MISPLPCATQISATGNGTEEPRQEHEGVLNKDCRGSQGVAVTWTALTGTVVQCGESQWHFPHKPPNGGEPTMRKGSYSEELVKIDLHVENLLLPPRSPKEQ